MKGTELKDNRSLIYIKSGFMEVVLNPEETKKPLFDRYSTKEAKKSRLYQTNPNVTFMEHFEKMYDFNYEDYVKAAHKVLKDTNLEYRYYINKAKLYYAKNELTQSQLQNYFTKSIPAVICNENIMRDIIEFFTKDNDKVQIQYFGRENHFDIKACCIPINIPKHISVLVDKIQTVYDLRYLLHELGHALSLSKTFSIPESLQAYLYNEMMQEAYADLFENLVFYNNCFQIDFNLELSLPDIEICRFEEFYHIRSLAAMVIYLKEFYTNKDGAYLKAYYQELMQKSLMVHIKGNSSLIDANTSYLAVQSFIGKIIASEIGMYLEGKYGAEWYRKETALHILNQLFSYGGLVTPNNYKKYVS